MLIYDVDITYQMINLKLKIMHDREPKNPKKKEIWQLKECDAESSICCKGNVTKGNWKSFRNVERYIKSIRRGLDIEKFSVDISYTTLNVGVRSSPYIGIMRHTHSIHTYEGFEEGKKKERIGVRNNDEEEWKKVFEGIVTKRSGEEFATDWEEEPKT